MLCRQNSTGSEPPVPGERCRCSLRNTFPGTEWLQNTSHLTMSLMPHLQIPQCQTLSLSSPSLPCSICSLTPPHLSQPPPAPNPDGSEVFPQQTPSSRSSTMLLQHLPTLQTKKEQILSLWKVLRTSGPSCLGRFESFGNGSCKKQAKFFFFKLGNFPCSSAEKATALGPQAETLPPSCLT